MASFSYQAGTLICSEGKRLTLYGAWDQHFGCWYSETGEQPYLPRVPEQRLFHCSGVSQPVDFTGVERHGDEDPAAWHAFERYTEIIPLEVAQLAGHFGRHQWLALEAMRHFPGFSRLIRQELDTADLGFIVACWELAEAKKRPFHDRRQLAHDMLTWKRADLLSRLTDLAFTRTIARLLQRSSEFDMTREYVLDLYCAVKGEGLAQVLGPLETIDPHTLGIARALPEWLRLPWLVDMLQADGIKGTTLHDVFPVEVLEAPPVRRAGILQALRAVNADGMNLIYSLRDRWMLQTHGTRPFPRPPIPGDERLRPISTPKALLHEGKSMRHCVGQYWQDVTDGLFYYYQWLGDERATVQLERDKITGRWILAEHLGQKNEPLTLTTILAIREVVDSQLSKIQSDMTVHVVGAQYAPPEITVLLDPGDHVSLLREPENASNAAAVAVYVGDVKLGYVDWDRVAPLAASMDAGVPFMAKIAEPEVRSSWAIFIEIEEPPMSAEQTDDAVQVLVAGAAFYHAERVWRQLLTGMPVTLRRERTNPHDTNAIEVLFGETKLGYVPRGKNQVLADAMDRGLPVQCSVAWPGAESPYDIPLHIEVGADREECAA